MGGYDTLRRLANGPFLISTSTSGAIRSFRAGSTRASCRLAWRSQMTQAQSEHYGNAVEQQREENPNVVGH